MKTIMWFVFVLGALSAAGKVILTKQGQKATIECGVDTYRHSLTWRRENEQIINLVGSRLPTKGKGDTAQRSRVTQMTSLEISKVKEGDAGKFDCTADGKAQEHTLLVVSVSASPSVHLQLGSEATLQCQVKGLNPGSTVQWTRPDGNPHTGSQPVRLTSVAHSDAGIWVCKFSHDTVTYSESLDIKVEEPPPTTPAPSLSRGAKNMSKKACPKCVTVSLSGAGLSWWVWVAVGVGCLVVVLLMVSVIVLCKRIRRRKRKMQKMKNGRQLLKPKKYCECDRPTAAAKSQQGRRREKPSGLPLQPLLIE